MNAKMLGILYLAFALMAPLLLASCSNGIYSREEYQDTMVDWPYSVFVAYRNPYSDDEDADLWNLFHRRFHDLLHEEKIEYIEYIEYHVIVIYVKDADCQRAMTIINRYVNADELRVVSSWDDMMKKDYFLTVNFVPLQPGITFGYNSPGKGRACSAPGQ